MARVYYFGVEFTDREVVESYSSDEAGRECDFSRSLLEFQESMNNQEYPELEDYWILIV